MNTKLHAICDSQGRPLNLFVTAGQVSDYIGARAMVSSLPKVDWLLGDRGPVEVDAPATVEVVLRTQKEKGRSLIHLINLTGEMQRPIERVIPLNDIAMKVKVSGVKKVFALAEQANIPFQSDGEG